MPILNWHSLRWRPLSHIFILHTCLQAEHRFMAYVDDTTLTSTHTGRKYIQPYLQTVYDWTKHNNLTSNPDKITCILFTPESTAYKGTLYLKTALPMAMHSKVTGLTLDPKHRYSTHIHYYVHEHNLYKL